MSLIDEALKRAQAAHQGEGRPEEGSRPWTPAPLPDRQRIARARARTIAAVFLAVAAMAVAGTLLFRRERKDAVRPSVPPASSTDKASGSAGLPPIESEVTVAPPPRGLPSLAGPPGETRPASTPPPSAASVRPAASSPASPAAAHLTLPAAAGRAEAGERKPRGPAEVRAYVGEMPLPGGGKISLDGIVYSESNPVAVVNGKVLPPGGYVEGFTIVTILPDRVELEREGAKIFLTLR
jgi:hypothetical protein